MDSLPRVLISSFLFQVGLKCYDLSVFEYTEYHQNFCYGLRKAEILIEVADYFVDSDQIWYAGGKKVI